MSRKSGKSRRHSVPLLCSCQQSGVSVFGQQLKRRLHTRLGHRVGALREDPDRTHAVGHLREVGRRRAAVHVLAGQDGQSLEGQGRERLFLAARDVGSQVVALIGAFLPPLTGRHVQDLAGPRPLGQHSGPQHGLRPAHRRL